MIFQSQINQYQAYTDRYLAFKLEYRKMVPYVKPKVSIGVNFQQAAAALANFSKAVSRLGIKSIINLQNNTEQLKLALYYLKEREDDHQKFLLEAKSYMPINQWRKYGHLINRIDPDNYGCFLNMICCNDFEIGIALEILPEVRKLYTEYLIPTHQWLASRKAYSKLEDKIDSLMEEEND